MTLFFTKKRFWGFLKAGLDCIKSALGKNSAGRRKNNVSAEKYLLRFRPRKKKIKMSSEFNFTTKQYIYIEQIFNNQLYQMESYIEFSTYYILTICLHISFWDFHLFFCKNKIVKTVIPQTQWLNRQLQDFPTTTVQPFGSQDKK